MYKWIFCYYILNVHGVEIYDMLFHDEIYKGKGFSHMKTAKGEPCNVKEMYDALCFCGARRTWELLFNIQT